MFLQPTTENILIISLVFLIAGFIKGVIGFGLPSVALALLTTMIGLKAAISILVLPALLTNLWQGFSGGRTLEIAKKIKSYLIFASIFTWVGVEFLSKSDGKLFSVILGCLLIMYAITSIKTPNLRIPKKWGFPTGALGGIISGILTGITGSFVFPSIIYLQALGFPRDTFIQAMGITFTIATISLGISLGSHNLMPINMFLLSFFGLIPTFAGMYFGISVRKKINDKSFKSLLNISLILIGVYIVVLAII